MHAPARTSDFQIVFDNNLSSLYVCLLLFGKYRLNKIGKNPNLMSQKDDEISNPDESAINAVVNALAAVESKEEK